MRSSVRERAVSGGFWTEQGGPCSNDPNCHDIDFNNDGVSPDALDIDALLSVFGGGPCL